MAFECEGNAKVHPSPCRTNLGSYDQEMSLTSESDEAMLPPNSIDSPPAVDDNNYGNTGSNSPLKKGPWTATEDDILMNYVQKHGEGNWNAVQKHTGLSRCGKSCRLRWANHLRPDLKKGPFSDEEERQIIELHAKYGNKWARMAAELPGRTDNEIKNFWNTRIKRRQKAGLPIYPDDVCPRLQNENHDDEIDSSYSTGEVHPADFVPVEDFEIPPVEFKSPNQPINRVDLNTINIPRLPAGALPVKNLLPSYNYRSMCPVLHSPKPPGSELLFNGYNTPIASSFTDINHLSGDGSLQIAQPLGFSPFYEHNSVPDQAVFSKLFPGNHTILSGTSELPSLQNQRDGWGEPSPTFPMPAFDDILIQNHQAENPCMFSAPNSGLLDDVLYESETKKFNTNASLFPQTSDIPTMAAHIVNDSTQDTQENLWGYDGQFSPVGNSSAPAFWDGSSFSVNSFEEPQSENEFPGGSSELIFPNCLKEKRDPGANANLKMARSTW